MGADAVIPGKKNRIQPIDYDKHIYKERHLVENFFSLLNDFEESEHGMKNTLRTLVV